ncbi:unnamed protein product [Linum tenue]|uniref:Uncharacterized protein n=1 Tax=Linum tenue TaxID=586396 RepID=A0AAV0PNH5_9ROSI|nr:unnamed protein product [Linum tenue]
MSDSPSNGDGSVVLPLTGDDNHVVSLNPTSQLPTKLNKNNFPQWRAQLLTLLRGLDLLSFVDGTKTAPAEDAPGHNRWYRQDQLILHAILSSVSDVVSPYISASITARQAYSVLERMYAGNSRSRIIGLKTRLVQERQGNRSVSAFLQEMRTICTELALVQAPVADEDLVLNILRGLNSEFGPLAAALRARENPIDVEDLHDRLVEFETDLAANRHSPTTAFSIHRGSGGVRGAARGRGFSPSKQPSHQRQFQHPQQTPHRQFYQGHPLFINTSGHHFCSCSYTTYIAIPLFCLREVCLPTASSFTAHATTITCCPPTALSSTSSDGDSQSTWYFQA